MKWERLARRLKYRDVVLKQGEVEERNRERIPQNTRNSTAWHIRVWDEWALTSRNSGQNGSRTCVVRS